MLRFSRVRVSHMMWSIAEASDCGFCLIQTNEVLMCFQITVYPSATNNYLNLIGNVSSPVYNDCEEWSRVNTSLILAATSGYLRIFELIIRTCISYFSFLVLVLVFTSFLARAFISVNSIRRARVSFWVWRDSQFVL